MDPNFNFRSQPWINVIWLQNSAITGRFLSTNQVKKGLQSSLSIYKHPARWKRDARTIRNMSILTIKQMCKDLNARQLSENQVRQGY